MQAFLSGAVKLDGERLGHGLKAKLQYHSWLVRLKAMCMGEALFWQRGSSKMFDTVGEMFGEDAGPFFNVGNSHKLCWGKSPRRWSTCVAWEITKRMKSLKEPSVASGSFTRRRNSQVGMQFFTFALIFLVRVDVEKILPLVFFELLMEKLPLSCL